MATKTTRTKTTSPASADQPQQLAVPAAIRSDAAPAAPKSAADMLAGLAGKPTAPAPVKKGKDRPVINLTGVAADVFSRFAPAKQLADIFTAVVDSLKGELTSELFDFWVSNLWKNKTLPENPSVRATSAKGDVCEEMFVVQERWKLQIPNHEDPAGSVKELLVEKGLDTTKAAQLVLNEIDFQPQVSIKPFNDLVEGTAEEQAVSQKLLQFVTTQLSAEEQSLILQRQPKAEVRKGVLERICQYANNEDQLASIFEVLVPVVQNKGAKFAITATPVERTNRLLEEAQLILGNTDE